MIKHLLWVQRGTLECWRVCVCAHRRVIHFAFFHWQSLGTFTQGGSKRSKHLQAGLGLNQHPRNKQYNKIRLSSSHLFFKKSDCALSTRMLRLSSLSGSGHYRPPVLRLDSILSCPIWDTVHLSWLSTEVLQSQNFFTYFLELIKLESNYKPQNLQTELRQTQPPDSQSLLVAGTRRKTLFSLQF